MTERSVRAAWGGDYRCDVEASSFTVRVDEPTAVGGSDTGPQPTELFLASIASCFTLALAHAARKREIPVSSIAVKASGTYDGPRFSAIRIEAEVGCDPDALDVLLRAAERVCYVTNTLRTPPTIEIAGQVPVV